MPWGTTGWPQVRPNRGGSTGGMPLGECGCHDPDSSAATKMTGAAAVAAVAAAGLLAGSVVRGDGDPPGQCNDYCVGYMSRLCVFVAQHRRARTFVPRFPRILGRRGPPKPVKIPKPASINSGVALRSGGAAFSPGPPRCAPAPCPVDPARPPPDRAPGAGFPASGSAICLQSHFHTHTHTAVARSHLRRYHHRRAELPHGQIKEAQPRQ